MSNIKNYNALTDSVIWSKDGTNNIQLNSDSTSSSIQLNRDLNTVPIATTLNPTGVSNGGFTTNWERIAKVQQAFSSVELPDNATELKVNNTVNLTGTTTNFILEKANNNIAYPYNLPPNNFINGFHKRSDKNIELGMLGTEIDIVKNVIPDSDINSITATVSSLTFPAVATRNNFAYGVFSNINKWIRGVLNTSGIKTLTIQNYANTSNYNVDLASLLGLNTLYNSYTIYSINPYTYTSQTNAVFTVQFTTNALPNQYFCLLCNGDPTQAGSYTISTQLNSTLNKALLVPQLIPNGSTVSFTNLNTNDICCCDTAQMVFYDTTNEYYIFHGTSDTPEENVFTIFNKTLSQGCYYNNVSDGLSNSNPLFFCVNPETGIMTKAYTNNTTNNLFFQCIYWNKTTKILYQSKPYNLTSFIPNFISALAYNNQECYSLIIDNYIYSYFRVVRDMNGGSNYETWLLKVRTPLNSLGDSEFLGLAFIETMTGILLSNINNYYYSLFANKENVVQIYSSFSGNLILSNDFLLTRRNISFNIGIPSSIFWTSGESENLRLTNNRVITQFVRPTHIIGISSSGANLDNLFAITLTYPFSSPVDIGRINITGNNLSIEANNNLNLQCNNVGVGGTISLTGGTGLLSATAGSNSGQHLRIFINGTPYKINLFND